MCPINSPAASVMSVAKFDYIVCARDFVSQALPLFLVCVEKIGEPDQGNNNVSMCIHTMYNDVVYVYIVWYMYVHCTSVNGYQRLGV